MRKLFRVLILAGLWLAFLTLPSLAEIAISPTILMETGGNNLLQDTGGLQLAALTADTPLGSRRRGLESMAPAGTLLLAQAGVAKAKADPDDASADEAIEEEKGIADPLEPVNRVFFHFNDKCYFWLLKPVATGYSYVLPEKLRICVRNFFSNLLMPVRAVNCLLQGKLKGFGTEVTRFAVNTTIGIVGFGDAGKIVFDLDPQNEDFGQTLGFYGLGPGFYIDWPLLGPSSLRDTAGMVGDACLNPINYLGIPIEYSSAVRAYDWINQTSLVLGEYESLKRDAFDPYIALRNAYHQNREYKIKN